MSDLDMNGGVFTCFLLIDGQLRVQSFNLWWTIECSQSIGAQLCVQSFDWCTITCSRFIWCTVIRSHLIGGYIMCSHLIG